MSLRRICVHMDDTATGAARVRFSARLARQHDASLCGIYLPHRPGAVHSGQREASGDHFQTEAHSRTALHAAEHLFSQVCAESDIEGDWHSPYGAAVAILSSVAKATDLCIVGQPDAPGGVGALGVDGLGDVIVSCGVPVMGLPHNVTLPQEIRRIVVAWNGSRTWFLCHASTRGPLSRSWRCQQGDELRMTCGFGVELKKLLDHQRETRDSPVARHTSHVRA